MGKHQPNSRKDQIAEWLAYQVQHNSDNWSEGGLRLAGYDLLSRPRKSMGSREQVKHGDMIRMEGWTDCAIHVADIGSYMIVGTLVDIKREQIIKPLFLASLDENWSIVKSAEDLIASL